MLSFALPSAGFISTGTKRFGNMSESTKTTPNRTNTRSDEHLDMLWSKKAIQEELRAIGRLHGDNPHRPDSEFWKSLIRMASVLKGSGRAHFTPSRVRTAVLRQAPSTLKTKGNRERDIEYLFGRAMNQARPRYRIKGVK
jgi:hypothetical protein